MLPLLACCLTVALHTWTVDDDGPADFDQIGTAVAAAAAGDVLLVEPGTYDGFVLEKRLAILGRAGVERPHVLDTVRLRGAGGFTFAGFDVDSLRVQSVQGRGCVDDCSVNVLHDTPQQYAMIVTDCTQLVISRTTIEGSESFNPTTSGNNGSALHVTASHVMLVDCAVKGAHGYSPSGCCFNGGKGGNGLVVDGASHVVAAGCAYITGGEEGWGTQPFASTDGQAGDGLVVVGSTVTVRGTLPDYLLAGYYDSSFGGSPGKAIVAASGSKIVVSGVDLGTSWTLSGGSQVLQPAVPEPYLVSVGSDVPGGAHELRLYGPTGVPALVAVSAAPALTPLPAWDEQLWAGLGAPFLGVVPVVMLHQFLPVQLPITMPPAAAGLEGSTATFQAFCPSIASGLDPQLKLASNAAELIVRF
jgi:hypothetical protein